MAGPRVLHLSLHKGCIAEIEQLGRFMGWELTTWNPFSSRQSAAHFLAHQSEHPMCVYNMTHDRAERVYKAHIAYFNSFDFIMTSDTAQLSRIFLQNGWKKPLIIWVCNRFNYCVGPDSKQGFDKEYYDLFRIAMQMPNVRVVSYTPFEHYYAALHGVDIRPLMIKPIGSQKGVCSRSAVPQHISKAETLFIYPGYPGCDKTQLNYIVNQCASLNFPTYSGAYNGADDLADFKGVIYFPYQASNLVFFENIQRGIIHFVPSERFIEQLCSMGAPIWSWYEMRYCEWYFGEHRDIIVYFDSWNDLQHKVATTDYLQMRKRIAQFADDHKELMLNQWRTVLKSLF